jgi:ABC-type Na+ transport system ATPase subunit NatA
LTVVRATDVRFVRASVDLVTPFSFALLAGETYDLRQPTARAASIAARLCAAIVKPSTGSIVVGHFETRLQAPEAKRRIGFVDARGFVGDAHAFRCEVAFHADVWAVAPALARTRAEATLDALQSDTPYARAIALAFVAEVSLIVLDAPEAGLAARVRAIAPEAALVRTHAGSAAASAS